MQDVLVNAFSKEVNANTEVTHFFHSERYRSRNMLVDKNQGDAQPDVD
jgi:hypothetical protein